jgi:hypothetical protein
VLQLGVNSTPYAIFGAVAFRGQPTLSQLHALYDAIRTRGDLPDTMDGATITHRWSLRDELRGTIVVDGQTAPAQLTDTVTRAPVDALVRQGSPVVRVIDQSADGRRTLGAQGFSASNYLTASWQEAPSAAALGFWAAVPVRISKSTAADEFFVDFAPLGRPSGWGFALHGTAWTVIFYGIGYSAAAPIVASDLDVTLLLLLNYTGTKLQFFMRGVQVGSDVVIAYPVPTVPSGPVFSIGRGTNTMLAQGFGYAGGSVAGGLTLAQVQQAFAEFDATGRTPTMQGLAQHRYDLTLDTLASGVDAVPAVVLDRVGSDHLTRVGGVSSAGGLVLAQRTERLWSYEATPILHGVQSLSVANFYTTAGIPTLVGSAAGFWVAVLLRIDSQAVASATRLAASTMSTAPNAGNAGGWYMQTTGTHSMIMFVPINVGGSGVSSPVSIVSASDVGKLLLVVGVHDGAKSRLYIKRAEQGTGSAISGYTPGTNPLNIGRDPRAILPADGLTVFGLAGGNGIPSLAEVQALHDAVLASEDIVAIPGRTDFLVSVKRDTLENGGVIPTQLKDRIGTDHMSKQGNPTLAPVFARAAGW